MTELITEQPKLIYRRCPIIVPQVRSGEPIPKVISCISVFEQELINGDWQPYKDEYGTNFTDSMIEDMAKDYLHAKNRSMFFNHDTEGNIYQEPAGVILNTYNMSLRKCRHG